MSSTDAASAKMRYHFVPLSQRPISVLRARAEELRLMARTATTVGTQMALLTLADRFNDLADRRVLEAEAPVCDHLQPAQPT
jgi:hypothetical protein